MMQFLHESIYESVLDKLVGVYKQVKVGDPLEKGTLVGPLHTRASRENFEKGIAIIKSQACLLFPMTCWDWNVLSVMLDSDCLNVTLEYKISGFSFSKLFILYISRVGRS